MSATNAHECEDNFRLKAEATGRARKARNGF